MNKCHFKQIYKIPDKINDKFYSNVPYTVVSHLDIQFVWMYFSSFTIYGNTKKNYCSYKRINVQ